MSGRQWILIAFLALTLLSHGCGSPASNDGSDADITTRGQYEVTARIVAIPGVFPSNELYDYAYVMQYDVLESHRGDLEGTLFVGHYNPLKSRTAAADSRSGDIGGNATRFRVGDVQRIALEEPLMDYCMAGIVNEFAEQTPADTPLYWAVWTNDVIP